MFYGTKSPYLQVLVDGNVDTENLQNQLTSRATVVMNKVGGGIDSANFFAWAKLFVDYVRPLTAAGRMVLLTYDDYREHMNLAVLDLFFNSGIIAYSLPDHTNEPF